jgi:hypothetical protein
VLGSQHLACQRQQRRSGERRFFVLRQGQIGSEPWDTIHAVPAAGTSPGGGRLGQSVMPMGSVLSQARMRV